MYTYVVVCGKLLEATTLALIIARPFLVLHVVHFVKNYGQLTWIKYRVDSHFKELRLDV